ncbi:hypothetical protein DSS3P8_190 [Roseobacter phage DSS3P8]|nr:hypothetical protein DSS3P8_190 [Roseobacter phage DSS3P8]
MFWIGFLTGGAVVCFLIAIILWGLFTMPHNFLPW